MRTRKSKVVRICVAVLACVMMLTIVGLPYAQSDLSHDGSRAHTLVADTHHWGPSAFGAASTAGNWVEASAPTVGDDIIFAQGGSCTWDISGIIFNTFTVTSDFSKWINVTAGIYTAGAVGISGGIVKCVGDYWYARSNFIVSDYTHIATNYFNLYVYTNAGNTIDCPWVGSGTGAVSTAVFQVATNVVNLNVGYGITNSGAMTVSGNLGISIAVASTYVNTGGITGTGGGNLLMTWISHCNRSVTFGTINLPTVFQSNAPAGQPTMIRLATDTTFGSSLTINATLYSAYTDPIILWGDTSNRNLTVRGILHLGSYARVVQSQSFINLTGGLNISGTSAYYYGFTNTNGYVNISSLDVWKGTFNATNGKVKATSVVNHRATGTTIIFPAYALSGTPSANNHVATNYSFNTTIRTGSVGVNHYNLTGNASAWLSIVSSNATRVQLGGFPGYAGNYTVNLKVNDSFSSTWKNWTISVSDAIPIAPWYWTSGNYLAYAADCDFDENGVARQWFNSTWIYNVYTIGRIAGEIYHNWFDTGNTAGLPMFWNQINWMITHENITGNHSVWLTNYTVARNTVPMAGVLGSGWVIACLLDAYALTLNATYLDIIWRGVLAYCVPLANNGLCTIWNGTIWYEEEGTNDSINIANPSHIFNGMQFGMSALYYLYEYNGSALAKAYFDKGVIASKIHYADFDTGMWQRYSMTNYQANSGYLALHRMLANWLYSVTSDSFFDWESDRITWMLDLPTAGYTVSGIWASNYWGLLFYLTDKSITTGSFNADVGNVDQYVNIVLDLGSKKYVNYFGYYGASFRYCPRNWSLWSSDDNATWTLEADVFNLTEGYKLFLFNQTFQTRYLRLNISETISGYFVVSLIEIIVGSSSLGNLIFAEDSFSHPYFNSTLGRLNITLQSGFSVSVDGGAAFSSNQSLELSDGIHQLDCTDNYSQTRTLLVSVKFGLITLINVSSSLFPQIVPPVPPPPVPPPPDRGDVVPSDSNWGYWLIGGAIVAVLVIVIFIVNNGSNQTGKKGIERKHKE